MDVVCIFFQILETKCFFVFFGFDLFCFVTFNRKIKKLFSFFCDSSIMYCDATK